MIALRLELRRARSLAVWLAVAVAAYGVVMGAMYPFMKSNDELMTQYLHTMPKEFLAAFGVTGILSDPGVFFTTYMASWLWPIIATSAALLLGTRAVAVDLERGFLDLPLATPISRTRYLAVNIAVQAMVMAALAAAAVLGVWVTAAVTGTVFDLGGYSAAGVLSFAFGCAIAGPTTLLSVTTLSRGKASGIVGGVVFGWGPGQSPLGGTFTTGTALERLLVVVCYASIQSLLVAALAFLLSGCAGTFKEVKPLSAGRSVIAAPSS